jgi:glycosyltransferase involved in cell wall biosynthesis
MPSIHESFGVPIIEGLSKSCSVCASNAGAFPEIGNDLAFYFELNNKKEFIESIENLLMQKLI